MMYPGIALRTLTTACLLLRHAVPHDGQLGIEATVRPRYLGECDFGYVLHNTYWNHGDIHKALCQGLDGEFGVLGTPWITAAHRILHLAAGQVVRTVGMHSTHTFADTAAVGSASAHRVLSCQPRSIRDTRRYHEVAYQISHQGWTHRVCLVDSSFY